MKNFFGKKSRNALALVLMISLGIHLVAIVIFGAIKFVSAIREEEKVLEAVTIEAMPETKQVTQVNIQERTKSTPPPRPQAIAVNTPLDLDIPSLDIDINIETSSVVGRNAGSFGGGVSELKNAALDVKFTEFGYTGQVEGTLKGVFFDTKQNPRGKPLLSPNEISNPGFLMKRMQGISKEFTSGNWSLRELERKYYRAERDLFASYWLIQKGPAEKAPRDFGVEAEVEPRSIMILYEGTFTPQESGEFRFYAKADDIIVVNVDSKIVVDGSYYFNNFSPWRATEKGKSNVMGIGGMPAAYGDWMKWEKGKPLDIQVLIGEAPGGQFGCFLLYQKKGEDRLRVFSTKPLTNQERKSLEAIHPNVAEWL